MNTTYNIDWIEFPSDTAIEDVIDAIEFFNELDDITSVNEENEEETNKEDEFMIESIIATMDNYRKRTHWDFKNAETFWKYYHNELRDLLQKTYL